MNITTQTGTRCASASGASAQRGGIAVTLNFLSLSFQFMNVKRIEGGTKYLLLFSVTLLGVLSFTLSSCGGGGGGGGGGSSGPPFIGAELHSFPVGSIPTGFNSGASVAVLDDSSGASITTAAVTMNGVSLTYDVANQDYEGNVLVAPGGAVTLSVSVGGSTYTASATQFTSYPTVSAPVSGATWNSSVANTVTWSGGFPTANAVYGLGVLDAADPNGKLIWPTVHFLQEIPIGTTSFPIPAASITAGNRLMVVGIASSGVSIPNAAAGSSLVVGGFNYVPITVSGMPVTSRTSGTLSDLQGIAWSGTQFVAVGSGGTILTSPDGITWTSRNSGTSGVLNGATWSGTKFVIVGEDGTILTSPDGTTWTSRISGVRNSLHGVTWSGTEFVAVGTSIDISSTTGIILTSPDGITWTQQDSGASNYLLGVASSGTQFVAVGFNGVILTSPDGATWTGQFNGVGRVSNLNGVTWSGTQFVVAGYDFISGIRDIILTSPDGVVWTPRSSGVLAFPNAIAWSGTAFAAVGGQIGIGTILTSPDGITWTQQASGASNYLLGVASSGTKFVAVGIGGTILTSP